MRTTGRGPSETTGPAASPGRARSIWTSGTGPADSSPSVYGTLLLPGAVAAAKAKDRSTAGEYLEEAEGMAKDLGSDANPYGPPSAPPTSRFTGSPLPCPSVTSRPRSSSSRSSTHSLEVVNAFHARNKIDEVINELLGAERRAPEQVHDHIMSRQLVLKLRATAHGKPSRTLADLARRMKIL